MPIVTWISRGIGARRQRQHDEWRACVVNAWRAGVTKQWKRGNAAAVVAQRLLQSHTIGFSIVQPEAKERKSRCSIYHTKGPYLQSELDQSIHLWNRFYKMVFYQDVGFHDIDLKYSLLDISSKLNGIWNFKLQKFSSLALSFFVLSSQPKACSFILPLSLSLSFLQINVSRFL